MIIENVVNIELIIAYGLLAIALLAALILPLINAVGNPGSLVKMGIGVLGLLLVFLISYLIAGNEVTADYAKYFVGPELSKFIGGMLNLSFIMIVGALLGIFYTEISKMVK